MDIITKYKLRSINYNLIAKSNCINIKFLPQNITSVELLIKNKFINSPYELITVLFLIQFISNQKPIILKSKKDNVLSGIRKNDSLSGKVSLKKKNLMLFFFKIINEYFKTVDFSRLMDFNSKNKNILFLNIHNINKIDPILLKEVNLIKNYTIEIILKQKNVSSRYKFSNNINLLLSHLKFPFNI